MGLCRPVRCRGGYGTRRLALPRTGLLSLIGYALTPQAFSTSNLVFGPVLHRPGDDIITYPWLSGARGRVNIAMICRYRTIRFPNSLSRGYILISVPPSSKLVFGDGCSFHRLGSNSCLVCPANGHPPCSDKTALSRVTAPPLTPYVFGYLIVE